MNFNFVDRILHSEPGKHVVGVKHITPSDTYFTTNQRGDTILMPTVIGETLGQLIAWNIIALKDFTIRPVAGVVGEVTVLGDARIGDSLHLETWVDELDDQALRYHSVASVRGKPVLHLTDAIGPFLPIEMFNAPDQVRQQYAMIHRPGEWVEPPVSNSLHDSVKPQAGLCDYDHIIEHQVGERLIASKQISILAPYFEDHFPRKPVLPLSLLLQSNVELMRRFFTDASGIAKRVHVSALRKIKIKAFAQPGDCITTELTLKQATADHSLLQCRTKLDGKMICSCEIVCQPITDLTS